MAHQFRNDYAYLAHPRILDALSKHLDEQFDAYGLDKHSLAASKLIKERFGCPDAEVFFLSGGTQTNLVFISKALRHYEAVICADTGHINVHEAAAIEGSGIKLITVKNVDGKLDVPSICETYSKFVDEHMALPKMVYISNSTETGTIYSRKELEEISAFCKENELFLFLDGARLGNALMSKENDIDPIDLGGTKNGLLFGEALVVKSKEIAKHFRHHIKNKGAMLAKGFALGIQFEEAFKEDLYFELARHSNEMADLVKEGFAKLGISYLPSPTNQVFATLKKEIAKRFIDEFGCEVWNEYEDNATIRFVTSFNTRKEDVDYLMKKAEEFAGIK